MGLKARHAHLGAILRVWCTGSSASARHTLESTAADRRSEHAHVRTYAHMHTYCTQALHAMKTGALVTDEMVLGIIADRIKEDDCEARHEQHAPPRDCKAPPLAA